MFCLILLAQIPLIYRRFQISNLAKKIASLENERKVLENNEYTDYKGVVHVHSFLGGHSTATFDELIEGAKENELDFVVMTEHTSSIYNTAAMTLKGNNDGILFVNGNETRTADGTRVLFLPGFAEANSVYSESTAKTLQKSRDENRLTFVVYPDKFKFWEEDIDGLEVFSLHTNAKKINPLKFIPDASWSYWKYPELTIARYFIRPDESLSKYDRLTKNRKATLFAGNDAHANMGFYIFGDSTGNKFISFKLDRYATIFRLVRMHVLLAKGKKLTEENLLKGLENGNTFVGFDVLGDTSGFYFTAYNGLEKEIMGDEILFRAAETELKAMAPQISRFVIFRNGKKVFESKETRKINFKVNEKGTYRTEVYLDSLDAPFDKIPWILSNPIYIR